MTVRCNNVNYFTRGQTGNDGQTEQVPAATVSFNFIGEQSNTQMENFTLTFINLEGPIDYFPGKDYVLNIQEAVEE